MARTAFNINDVPVEVREGAASFGQCKMAAAKFAEVNQAHTKEQKTKAWKLYHQVRACLWGNSQRGKLTFIQAHELIEKKNKLPKKYKTQIANYLKANLEVS